MERAASEPPVCPVAELHPRPVLVEAGALPLGGAGVIVPRRTRGADEGREEVDGAAQREAAEQQLGHLPRQEREEVAREDGDAQRRLQEVPREEAGRSGEEEGEEEEEEEREGEELELGGSHGGGG